MKVQTHDIVVIGSSAGGVHALQQLAGYFDKEITASIFIVQHVSPDFVSILPQIISKASRLGAIHPADGEKIQRGMIYVAPPDHHMIIEDGHILVKKGPKENGFRPSIDALMRSAAYWYGSRVIGAVLTGHLNDGTSGLWTIKQFGGITVIQNPEDAPYPAMPLSVLKYVEVDYNVALAEIGPLLNRLVSEPAGSSPSEEQPFNARIKAEIDIAGQQNALQKGINNMGEKTDFTCPDCGGALVSFKEGNSVRYRCHTGHGFSWGSLWSGITETVETKLWQAMRSMEEGIIFLEQSATRCAMADDETEEKKLHQKAMILTERSKILLDFIYSHGQINDLNSL